MDKYRWVLAEDVSAQSNNLSKVILPSGTPVHSVYETPTGSVFMVGDEKFVVWKKPLFKVEWLS